MHGRNASGEQADKEGHGKNETWQQPGGVRGFARRARSAWHREPERETGVDWQNLRNRLAPLHMRWDLAVLVNLDSDVPVRPTQLIRAINAQSSDGQISWKVLEERLRCLESAGYIAREEVAHVPRETRYWLLTPGRRLIGAATMLEAWYSREETPANDAA